MRIAFMGTPDFSVMALNALKDAGHEIVCVYTQPPRRAGRGKSERKSPVHARAEALGLPVRTPLNFKDPADVAEFDRLQADIAVVVAYGLILPQSILDAPARGCLNIHASLLPRWRGAAPIQRAIMAGDQKTGVCIMQMDAGLDTGAVLLRRETPIDARDTYATVHDRLAGIGAEAVIETLQRIDDLEPNPQDETGVTYARKIDKAEAHIVWDRPANVVDCHIRGLSPFPGAWSNMNGERIKVLLSEVVDAQGQAGQTLDDQLLVGTAQRAVRLLKLQRAGKSVADANDLLRGFAIPKGTDFV